MIDGLRLTRQYLASPPSATKATKAHFADVAAICCILALKCGHEGGAGQPAITPSASSGGVRLRERRMRKSSRCARATISTPGTQFNGWAEAVSTGSIQAAICCLRSGRKPGPLTTTQDVTFEQSTIVPSIWMSRLSWHPLFGRWFCSAKPQPVPSGDTAINL
jgi:hypothetical protein